MLEIKNAICTQCDEEHGYTADIYKQYTQNYPLSFPGNGIITLDDIDPLWELFDKDLEPHKTICLVFNNEESLCQMHLEQKLKEVGTKLLELRSQIVED